MFCYSHWSSHALKPKKRVDVTDNNSDSHKEVGDEVDETEDEVVVGDMYLQKCQELEIAPDQCMLPKRD
jgi:hypothetical protein